MCTILFLLSIYEYCIMLYMLKNLKCISLIGIEKKFLIFYYETQYRIDKTWTQNTQAQYSVDSIINGILSSITNSL